jgi:anti-sigma factor RsiW
MNDRMNDRMNMTHISEDELILHFYGEIERADESRITSHLATCAECQSSDQQLRRVMTLVDTAAPVEAPLGFERTAWARLEPALDANRSSGLVRRSAWREGGWRAMLAFPQWAMAGGVAALVLAAFVAGRFSGGEAIVTAPAEAVVVTDGEPARVLNNEVGDHLDRTTMMLVELANAETDHADVLAGEQGRAADLVAANRLIRKSAMQSGDTAVVDILEDLERVLLEIANAPADASSNELTGLQSRITTEDLLFRLRVIASEMRQRTRNGREAGDRLPQRMPTS